ncbi:MAG: hypothetical protein MUF72_08425 [Elainella sp. Prado103]|nr:hypothetical protein [Elainella sp. Prado103]
METLLINEQFVSQFKFWQDGQIRSGMRFRKDLFECISQFNQHQRHQAFDLAWRLSLAGREVVVTVSPTQYTVWGNLRVSTPSPSLESVLSTNISNLTLPVPRFLMQEPALSA